MAKLVDALASGASDLKQVLGVRVSLWAQVFCFERSEIPYTIHMETLTNHIEAVIKKNSYIIEIGGKSELELEFELAEGSFLLSNFRKSNYCAQEMMQSDDFSVSTTSRQILVSRVKLLDLGFSAYPTREQIFEQTQKLGLELLPSETGPHARLQDRNQAFGNWYYIAMNPITVKNHGPQIFALVRQGDGLWLASRVATSNTHFGLDAEFVFGIGNQ
jgi:hypothetical protein